MSEGLFATYGIDAEALPEQSGGIPEGTYEATVLKAEVIIGTRKDAEAVNFVFFYRINGTETDVREYFSLPKRPAPWDDTISLGTSPFGGERTEKSQNEWLMSNLKTRLVALGVPENRVNGVKPEELSGLPAVITLVKNGDYTNIRRGKDGARAPKESGNLLPGTVEVTPTSVANAPAVFVPNWG